AFSPLLRGKRQSDPPRENLLQLLQDRVPTPFCICVLGDALKLVVERLEEVVDSSGQVGQFVVIDTYRPRPRGQGVPNGSAGLGQCIGSQLRGTARAVLRALSATPELAERLMRHDQTITQALESLDEVLGSLGPKPVQIKQDVCV